MGSDEKASCARPVNTHCSKTVRSPSSQPLASATRSNNVKNVSTSFSLNFGTNLKLFTMSRDPQSEPTLLLKCRTTFHLLVNSASKFPNPVLLFPFAALFFLLLLLYQTNCRIFSNSKTFSFSNCIRNLSNSFCCSKFKASSGPDSGSES